jgi:hypothetical protein
MKHLAQRWSRWTLLCVFLTLLVPCSTFAQSTRGELAGTVKDTTGAVVAGAKVVATGVDTGVANEAVTTSAGTFRFPELAIGRYNVVVSAPGFSASNNKGVLVTLNSTTALNAVLKPGAVSDTVTVDASAPTLDSESSDLGGTISAEEITELPLSMATGVNGLRSPEVFAFLVPGTVGPGAASTGLNLNGVFFARIGGGQAYGNETMVDGASITRSENGSSFDETSPSIEALQEFKVTTSVPEAEFGRTTGGFESFATKSGGNAYHGTAYTFVKNAAFDANDWFNNGYWAANKCSGNHVTASTACQAWLRASDSKFDYGGTLGGPIRLPNPLHLGKDLYNGKDKSFFFFSWEQYQLKTSAGTVATVPTAKEAGGDFSDKLGAVVTSGGQPLIDPCDGSQVHYNQIYDPSTTRMVDGKPCRTAYSGNIITSSAMSKAAQALIAGMPTPNYAGTQTTGGVINNYVGTYSSTPMNTTFTVRLDENLSLNHKVFFSYSSRDNFRELGSPDMPGYFSNNGYPQDFETHYIRAGWDWTLKPTLMNHFNVGYNRTNSKNFSPNIDASKTLSSVGAPNFYSNSFPIVTFSDVYSNWGVTNNGDNIDNGLRLNDSINWQWGRHSIRAGIDYRHQQYSVIQKTIPEIDFVKNGTGFSLTTVDTSSATGSGLASFLLGGVNSASQTVYNSNPQWNSWYFAGFVQDDFKVTPDLTVNLGLRYDVDVPRKEHHNNSSNFSFTAPDAAAGNLPGALEFGTNCGGCNSAWADTWKKDFAPRVGFAYNVPGMKGKTVVRGGAGIIYGPLQYSDFGGSMGLGWTQSRSINSTSTANNTTTFANFNPAFQLDSGYSTWTSSYFAPSTDPTQLTCGSGCYDTVGGEVITRNEGRPSMTTQWNIDVQHEVAQDLILTVGFTGQVSQNLHSANLSNFNNIDPAFLVLGDHLDNADKEWMSGGSTVDGVASPYASFSGPVGQALRPYPQYNYIQGDCCLENLGHSSFDALEASLNRHFRQGLNLKVSYTFSKLLTDADTIISDYTSNWQQAQNSQDRRGEKAVSIQNLPQQLSISYMYKLPFGKDGQYLKEGRLMDALVGGWEISGIQRYQSGSNVGFGCGSGWDYWLYQNCFRFSRGPVGSTGAGLTSAAFKKKKNGPNVFNGESWFGPVFHPAGTNGSSDTGVTYANAAFYDPNKAGAGWLRPTDCYIGGGNSGCSFSPLKFGSGIPRQTQEVTGPLWLQEDISLLKNFTLEHNYKFQFKVDASNLFNRHRMGMPDSEPADYPTLSGVATNGFGIPYYSDMPPRKLQISGRITF